MIAFDPPQLPVQAVIPELRQCLAAGVCAVLQAPPGAGKTTLVPLALLAEPWLAGRKIVMLEPRRLAARAAASRMAELLGEEVGQTVGYRIRLENRVGPTTRVVVVTEGILTAMLQRDAELAEFGLVIFDEFHERNLHADLGLALSLESQSVLRPELRLLVMSATLAAEAVAELLGGAPIIRSEGRSFPVTTFYQSRPEVRQLAGAVVAAVRRALAEQGGSILVFLPGTAEIKRVEQGLRAADLGAGVRVAPLYGSLPRARQDEAIRPPPPGVRKVVLATAIAETSLTIEGIEVVIDGGLMRGPAFDPGSGMSRLRTTVVAKASADQRRGRAGRLGPGVCYRLWSEEENRRLPPFKRPEILDVDLAPLALELARWGAAAPDLAWLDPPPPGSMAAAAKLLAGLGALDERGGLTPHGRQLAELGVHPRLGHMIVLGQAAGLGSLACDLASLLSDSDSFRGGGRDADLRGRLELLYRTLGAKVDGVDRGGLGGPGGPGGRGEQGAALRVMKIADQWRQKLAIPRKAGGLDRIGFLLAYAYPDRIGVRRPGGYGRYQLTNGKGAFLHESDPLLVEEYLVAAELDGDAREARIQVAAPYDRSWLEKQFAAVLEKREVVAWDDRRQEVTASRIVRLGELTISEERLARPAPELVVAALLTGLRRQGLGLLPWTPELREWQARVLFLRRTLAGESWPDVSDAALLATMEQWLAPFMEGRSRLAHLQSVNLGAALTALLPWPQQQQLAAWAPTHHTVPSGSKIRLHYEENETPVLAVRLQEMFGSLATPRIAEGKVPLLLHLLSPAGRPVQITTDLAGFWATGYPEVKKELKARYAKHPWPDDPRTAPPTRRTKKATSSR